MSIEKHNQAVDQRIKKQGEYVDNLPPVNEVDHGRVVSNNEDNGQSVKPTPFADPSSVGVGEMLDNAPEENRWLLNELMPLGVVGMLAAGGGTGKSYLTLQLAISVVTGRPFLGIDVDEPGGCLMIAAEDERPVIHRRLWRIVNHMQADGELNNDDVELIRERLCVVSSVGWDNRLTQEYDRQIIRTSKGERITELVNQLPTINMVILDPVSRFRGGDENDNEHATRFIEAAEKLRSDTGATVLMPHHVAKTCLASGAESLSMEGLRGASALVDGVRWAAAMATMRKDEAENYGLDPEEAGNYVRLDAVKNNYAAPWQGLWLERLQGGVLVPTTLEKVDKGDYEKQKRKESKESKLFYQTITQIQDLIRQHQNENDPLTNHRLRKRTGDGRIYNIGDKKLRAFIDRGIDEGFICVEQQDGSRYPVLKTPN